MHVSFLSTMVLYSLSWASFLGWACCDSMIWCSPTCLESIRAQSQPSLGLILQLLPLARRTRLPHCLSQQTMVQIVVEICRSIGSRTSMPLQTPTVNSAFKKILLRTLIQCIESPKRLACACNFPDLHCSNHWNPRRESLCATCTLLSGSSGFDPSSRYTAYRSMSFRHHTQSCNLRPIAPHLPRIEEDCAQRAIEARVTTTAGLRNSPVHLRICATPTSFRKRDRRRSPLLHSGKTKPAQASTFQSKTSTTCKISSLLKSPILQTSSQAFWSLLDIWCWKPQRAIKKPHHMCFRTSLSYSI